MKGLSRSLLALLLLGVLVACGAAPAAEAPAAEEPAGEAPAADDGVDRSKLSSELYFYNWTDYIDTAIREVITTLLETLLIVVVVIFLFFGSLRSALVPVIAIPLSLTAFRAVVDAVDSRAATQVTEQWLAGSDQRLVSLEVNDRLVRVTVEGSGALPPLKELANRLASTLDRTVIVSLRTIPTQNEISSTSQ